MENFSYWLYVTASSIYSQTVPDTMAWCVLTFQQRKQEDQIREI